jgi:TonB family protein
MSRNFLFVGLFLLVAGGASTQTIVPPAPGDAAATRPVVHYAGVGVTAPELIPANLTIPPGGHCKEMDGTGKLSVVVDGNGLPREFFLIKPLGSDLDKMMLNIVAADRFKPGVVDGVPAAVAISDEMKVQACIEERKEAGVKRYSLRVRSVPEQKLAIQTSLITGPKPPTNDVPPPDHESLPPGVFQVGGDITDPVVIKSADPEFSEKGRADKINGICWISLIVDTHGMPKNPKVKQSLEPSMDQNALAAIERYRFTPAMRNGEPVGVEVEVEVNFRLY